MTIKSFDEANKVKDAFITKPLLLEIDQLSIS